MDELKPLVEEYARLETAAAALAGVRGGSSAASRGGTRRRGPGRPRGSTTTAKSAATKAGRKASRATGRRAGRRKGSGTRAAEALALVKGQPGITIPELAAKMGIKQNYLYRVLPGLEQERKVVKQGRGWHPK
ncbi:MAG TPA: hypothetical protein VFW29_08035 [Solirubrobacteraceae bacterium]|nr:hypothetical protein [Solirubrobacteraceae bacterium]